MLNNRSVIQPYLPSEVFFFSLKHVKLPVKLPESNHFFAHKIKVQRGPPLLAVSYPP